MSDEVRVLLFGALRDRAGVAEVSSAAAGTVLDVWNAVAARLTLGGTDREAIRCARNLAYCGWDDAVVAGDELAFMPPVSGGSGAVAGVTVTATIAPRAIDVAALIAAAGGDADGAVACFAGRVRDHSDGETVRRLDYEAYEPMAAAVLRRLAAGAAERHGLSSVAVVHRVGELRVGEIAVAVVTASPHRGAALDACRELIDAVKAEAPIWKREHTASGSRWVDARCGGDPHG